METCEPALCVPDNDKNERKNPFRKKGNVWQSRRICSYKIQSMKTQQHQNANIGAGSILRAVASDAKKSLQNQQPQQTISFVRGRLLAKFLWP